MTSPFSSPSNEVHARLRFRDKVSEAIERFSFSEKTFFVLLIIVLIGSAFLLLRNLSNTYSDNVADRGGSYTEGLVGSPRFINPLLALSDADRDMVSLVYSGLMKITPEGEIVPDLAREYEISEDGLVYTFHIKEDARFHDGASVTAQDVVFTIQKVQDPAIKSPKRGSWDGVTVEAITNREVRMTLRQPFAPFLENATLGILPRHIWDNASADEFAFSPLNTEPIGSGPYKVTGVIRNEAGIPMEYNLKAFSNYTLGEPYITRLNLVFFTNENDLIDAYKSGRVLGMGGVSAEAGRSLKISGDRVERTPLSRVFAVFFNQNQNGILAEADVREALDLALNKHRLIDAVLFGYGQPLSGPIPRGSTIEDLLPKENVVPQAERLALAADKMEAAGWQKNAETGLYENSVGETLSFTLATGDTPELKRGGEIITEEWRNFGIDVSLSVFETGDLNQNVIRPRRYDALFFGEIIDRELDLFPFWHSSQRNDPGLNIALYTNSAADALIEEARGLSDPLARAEKYVAVVEQIKSDAPAVFTYSPEFIYVLPEKIRGLELGQMSVPSDRFLNIHEWYTEENNVWKIFIR